MENNPEEDTANMPSGVRRDAAPNYHEPTPAWTQSKWGQTRRSQTRYRRVSPTGMFNKPEEHNKRLPAWPALYHSRFCRMAARTMKAPRLPSAPFLFLAVIIPGCLRFLPPLPSKNRQASGTPPNSAPGNPGKQPSDVESPGDSDCGTLVEFQLL